MFKLKSWGFVKLALLFIGLLCMAGPCLAMVELEVSPQSIDIYAGETANFTITVSLNESDIPEGIDPYPITTIFSVNSPISGWDYSFSNGSVMLDSSITSNSSVLKISVPQNATEGFYTHTVNATSYDAIGAPYGIISEIDIYVINTNVETPTNGQIPEFPTIALPMLAVLGVVAVFGKRNK